MIAVLLEAEEPLLDSAVCPSCSISFYKVRQYKSLELIEEVMSLLLTEPGAVHVTHTYTCLN